MASLCSLAGRYVNPISTRFLAPMAASKIGPQVTQPGGFVSLESILGILKGFKLKLCSCADLKNCENPIINVIIIIEFILCENFSAGKVLFLYDVQNIKLLFCTDGL